MTRVKTTIVTVLPIVFMQWKSEDSCRTEFRNDSSKYLVISLTPEKPKRKYIDIFIVEPNSIMLTDQMIDLSRISFRFKE